MRKESVNKSEREKWLGTIVTASVFITTMAGVAFADTEKLQPLLLHLQRKPFINIFKQKQMVLANSI